MYDHQPNPLEEMEVSQESGPMSDERRIYEKATNGINVISLTDAVEEQSYNAFQKPNMLKKIEQLKETYTICKVGGAVEEETKNGYEIVVVDKDGNAKAFNYNGLATALGVEKKELPEFLEKADYESSPAKVGDYPGEQNPKEFFQELEIAA